MARLDAGGASPMSPALALGQSDRWVLRLFNNRRCVLVPPGVVEAFMEHMDPVAEYHRDGNLYDSDFTMSGFVRQGLDG